MTTGQLLAVELGESATGLESIGFDRPFVVGRTRLVPGGGEPSDGEPGGVRSVTLLGIDELDGLALRAGSAVDAAEPRGSHPNGVTSIDHVVVTTPNPDRTQAAFEAQGFDARRIRSFDSRRGRQRQTFYWWGDVICEVVGPDDGQGDGSASVWGLALTVTDIEATHRRLAPEVTDIAPAVQPGRSVCTLRSPNVSTPILFITPHARTAGGPA